MGLLGTKANSFPFFLFFFSLIFFVFRGGLRVYGGSALVGGEELEGGWDHRQLAHSTGTGWAASISHSVIPVCVASGF